MNSVDEAKKAAAKALTDEILGILKEHPQALVEQFSFSTHHYSEEYWNETEQVKLKLDSTRTLTLTLSTDMREERS